MRWRCWFLFLIAAAAVSILSCSRAREVRVGLAAPLSGPEAKTGQAVLSGAQLAVDQCNAAGGARGKRVTLIAMDDKDVPDEAERVAMELCKRRVAFVAGHVDSGCSHRAAAVYLMHRVVMISPASTSPALTCSGNPYVFRVCGRDDQQGKQAAIWFVNHMPGHKVTVVNDGSNYGCGLAKEFTTDYEFLTGGKVLFAQAISRGQSDFSALIAKLKADPPQMVYFGGLETDGAALLKAIRAAGIPCGFMAGDGCFGDEFIAKAGKDAAEGAMATFTHDLGGRPAYRDWLPSYKERFGEPGPFAVFGYTAVQVGLKSYDQAVYPPSSATLRDALHRLTFDTLFGQMKFDDRGDPNETPFTMWQVVDGKYTEVE